MPCTFLSTQADVAQMHGDTWRPFDLQPGLLCDQLELEERDTLMEMQIVRTRGRQLKCQLEKLKNTLALKDQLQLGSGNLHLVDYEQLQMENELLNEKVSLQSVFGKCH